MEHIKFCGWGRRSPFFNPIIELLFLISAHFSIREDFIILSHTLYHACLPASILRQRNKQPLNHLVETMDNHPFCLSYFSYLFLII